VIDANYDIENVIAQLERILDSDKTALSTIKPSEWVEANLIMEEPFPGPYRYSLTPYCREIIDCWATDHPMLWIAIMKGAQIGLSSGVIIPSIVWSIAKDPCRMLFTVGSPALIEKAMEKLDKAIFGAGVKSLIADQSNRKKNQKSGDTDTKKSFPGGFVEIFNAGNPNLFRDTSHRKFWLDDFEAVRTSSKSAGSTRKVAEMRAAAYENRHKLAYVSTPELAENSNIEEAYLLGDQRKYYIPCPCCGALIDLHWSIEKNGIQGGIVWEWSDEDMNALKPGSVKYRCQECGDAFNDKTKDALLNAGKWIPTAQPSKPGYYSYHISCLYAPTGFYGWEKYVYDYLEACPRNQPRKEALYQSFVNTVLGLTYKPPTENLDASKIAGNIADYEPGVVPDSLSVEHGNGHIVMLTCGADLNGKMKGSQHNVNDARLDYEVVAHSESGATYSILQGSIGTFKPLGGNEGEDRVIWSYEQDVENSVWPEFEKILKREFPIDSGGTIPIAVTLLDCSAYATTAAYPFLERTNCYVVGVKGEKEEEYKYLGRNTRFVKPSMERPKDLWILQVGLLKDRNAEYMALNHDKKTKQPDGFMNFPHPSNRMYEYATYFQHFEAEEKRVINKDGKTYYRWVKKNSEVQNHFLDCRVYNLAGKEIMMAIYDKETDDRSKVKGDWRAFAKILAEAI